MSSQLDLIISYENGELDNKGIIELFSELIKNGMAWTLQGHFGRSARNLIANGLLTEKGEITELGKTFIEEEYKCFKTEYEEEVD